MQRDIQFHFRATEHERDLILQGMEQLGTKNVGAYLRKMAIDGYKVRLNLPEVRELCSLLRRCCNNLNQLTRRAHETGSVYEEDIEDIRRNYDELWDKIGELLDRLAAI